MTRMPTVMWSFNISLMWRYQLQDLCSFRKLVMYMQCCTAVAIENCLILIGLRPLSLFCEINFNILPSLRRFSKWSLPFMFPHQNLVGIFLPTYGIFFALLILLDLIILIKIWWEVPIMHMIILQFSPHSTPRVTLNQIGLSSAFS